MKKFSSIIDMYDTVCILASREGLAVSECTFTAKILYIRTKHVPDKRIQLITFDATQKETCPPIFTNENMVSRPILLYRVKRIVPPLQILRQIQCSIKPYSAILCQQGITHIITKMYKCYFPRLNFTQNMHRNR